MDSSMVAIISSVIALLGVIGTGLFQFFSNKEKAESEEGVGYASAILNSHTAVWGEVAALREELREERAQNKELSYQLKESLEAMSVMVEQMGALNEEVQKLQKENMNLQGKVDRLTKELEWARKKPSE